jgi:putative SOS response-associated peptidase YedK
MDGYYEWRPNPDQPGRGRKTPFYFSAPDGSPLLVAGVWSQWRPEPGAAGLLSCTLVTAAAPARFAAIHDRVPLVLAEADWDRWLDPESPAPAALLAAPAALDALCAREVSTLVNSAANNGPDLIAPTGPDDQPVGLF